MGPNLYLILLVISLISGLVYFFQKNTPPDHSQKVILGILCIVMAMEFSGSFFARKGINNTLLYNLGWIYLESFMLIGYYFTLKKDRKFQKRIFQIAMMLLIWGMVNSMFFQQIDKVFQFYSFLPFGMLIIYLSMNLLLDIINLRFYPKENLLTLPHFWINCFIIFFYIEALLVFGTYQFFPEMVIANVKVIFGFNRLMAGIMYLTFGLAYFIPMIYQKTIHADQDLDAL
ncbi:hypothetical protein [Pararhodonellum marinum]|uniref:hypothetical protein n=1 Tax=Pararhodonellum marinum TaxID=2755358 RepID=UPI00188F0C8D|nr:hypothetical protein [Pararhodonellum marinum]